MSWRGKTIVTTSHSSSNERRVLLTNASPAPATSVRKEITYFRVPFPTGFLPHFKSFSR